MLFHFLTLLENVETVIGGSGGAAADTAVQAADTGSASSGYNPIIMVLVWVAVIAVLYFVSIRPQSKREKKLKEMQDTIKPGDNVVTTSGFYGTVIDLGEDCFVVEFGTNRGVRIPVRMYDITGVKTPSMHPNPAPAAK
ncbi:MAG: preprotein translocase subunit YajC [Clostridiales bacterium]|jgi:preprotein translocase subunit YajC|nr:preprotein translocase subunit YajC [Clostridiales bacterium]